MASNLVHMIGDELIMQSTCTHEVSQGKIFGALINFFNEDGWHPSQLEDQPALAMVFEGENGEWLCLAKAREEQCQFVFYSVCSTKAPLKKRIEMAEFIARANYGMAIGSFELDFNSGEIFYRTGIDVEGSDLTSVLIEPMVYSNVLTMDRYLPGIMQVLYGEVSPVDAIARIEETQSMDK